MTNSSNSTELLRWFGALVVIGPIHMLEQIWFGLDELQELKGLMAQYYSLFRDSDLATVCLVITMVTVVQLIVYGAIAGGRWRLLAAGSFGFAGVGEVHHLIKTVVHGAYFPGVVTSFGYVLFGLMILRAVWREWPRAARSVQERLAVA